MSIHKKVLMTGFGPYDNVETNPSWEGLKLLDMAKIENKYNISLLRREIPVKYSEVDTVVPLLWSNYQPHLTIHVGVSEAATCILLETLARRYDYLKADIAKNYPQRNENVIHGPDTLVTQLDVADICRKFNRNPPDDELHAKISGEAGGFLCEYIYYTSLCHGRNPTLFVHVPLNTYTSEQLTKGLERILKLCLDQLSEMDDYYNHMVN